MHKRRSRLLHGMAGLLAATMLLAATSDVRAATKSQTTQARHGNLCLSLTVRVSGSTMSGEAKLTNRGEKAWKYYGGCAPPVLQIQVRDVRGDLISGWKPPRVQCFALTVKYLKPHGSLEKGTWLSSNGTFYVRAVVPLRAGRGFQTRDIKVVLP